MKKFLHISVAFLLMFPISVWAMELPKLYSDKVLLYDPEEKEVLYEIGADEKSNIASLTKIMTTITAIEHIEDLDEVVTIDWGVLSEIPYDASVAGLKCGDKVTLRDLLYASILPSGADATTALAHNIAGSTKGFVDMMNEKALELGLQNTHFANVTGYDIPNHYSTPKEVLAILEYALENPLFEQIYKTRSYTLTNGLIVYSTLNTYNLYMKLDLSSILGSKTGYTGDAGMCMSAIIKTGGKELILITLGAPYSYFSPYNLQDTLAVIKYLDENYAESVLFESGRELFSIPVEGAKQENYSVRVKSEISKYVEVNYDENDVRFEYEGAKLLSYRNKKDERIGEVKYYYKDELVGREDVYLESALEFSLAKFVDKHGLAIVIVIVVFVVAITLVSSRRKKRRNKRRRVKRV